MLSDCILSEVWPLAGAYSIRRTSPPAEAGWRILNLIDGKDQPQPVIHHQVRLFGRMPSAITFRCCPLASDHSTNTQGATQLHSHKKYVENSKIACFNK